MPRPSNDPGAKIRSRLLAAHHRALLEVSREAQAIAPGAVLLLSLRDGATLPEAARELAGPPDVITAYLPRDAARRWLGMEQTAKWAHAADDAMDVVVVAGNGVSILRLTAR
jgi:hypothetical protein